MRHLPVFITLTLLLFSATSCRKTPSHVIPEDKMAALMADVNIGNAIVESERGRYATDSAKMVLMQSIYARHGVTAEQVDTSMVWYGHNIETYVKVCEKAEEILTARIEKAEQAGGKSIGTPSPTSLDGDSVNLWAGTQIRRITGTEASDFQTFSLFTDKNWDRGDRYTLSAKGINTRGSVTMFIAADYNDGTTEYTSLVHPAEDMQRLTFVVDSSKVATRVYGSLFYSGTPGNVAYLDSISLVRTRGRNDNASARRGQLTTRYR